MRFSWAELPWPIWAAVGLLLLGFGLGVWQLVRPGPSERIVPLFGVVDRRPSPPPSPSPSPSPSPRRPR